jgi:hypothetical protein
MKLRRFPFQKHSTRSTSYFSQVAEAIKGVLVILTHVLANAPRSAAIIEQRVGELVRQVGLQLI